MPLPPDMQQEADEKAAQERQQATQRFVKTRFDEDLLAVLGSPSGRRVLFSLMREAGFFNSIAVGAGMEFRAGRREVGILIRALIERVDPQLPARMELEWTTMGEPPAKADAPGPA